MATSTTQRQPEDHRHRRHEGLLFAWAGGKTLVAHLSVFIAASAGIHFFGFYLFQVVYPVTARVEPVPSRVRLLDPAQPAVNALMRQIDDRLVYLRPASTGSEAKETLAEHSAQFRPSFADRDLGFRPLPLTRMGNAGYNGDGIVLPPINQAALPDSPIRIWSLGGDLSNRLVRKAELLDKALAKFELEEGFLLRLSLSVDRQGDLRSVLPIAGKENPQTGALITAVRTYLRFERQSRPVAADEEEWQRGWLEIER